MSTVTLKARVVDGEIDPMEEEFRDILSTKMVMLVRHVSYKGRLFSLKKASDIDALEMAFKDWPREEREKTVKTLKEQFSRSIFGRLSLNGRKPLMASDDARLADVKSC